MRKRITWIVAADHQRARVFRKEGASRTLQPVPDFSFERPLKSGRDIVSDRPGRGFESHGTARHALAPPTDPRRVEAVRFVAELAERLHDAALNNEFHRLFLVLPPRALGELRPLLSPTVAERLKGELPEDLTKQTPDEVLAHLDSAFVL